MTGAGRWRRAGGALLLAALALAGALGPAPAAADGEGDGDLGRDRLTAGVSVARPGRPGGGSQARGPTTGGGRPGVGGRTDGIASPYVSLRTEYREGPAFRSCPDASRAFVYGTRPDGTEVLVTTWCPAAGGSPAGTTGPAAPAVGATPPAPPSAAAVRDAVALPTPTVRLDPGVRGLVGLETRLWVAGPREVAVDVALGGYAVTATARAARYRWDLGDGTLLEATDPGTPEAPAATHVYLGRGDLLVAVTVVWEGTYTFTGPAGSATADLGTVEVSTTVPYPVVEAQAVIR
ncbi:MAG: PKD domain-containing protein [Acidimicrobiales bacterium]|nr:PKD domain-containing protein [Acidimicrobiales bacterium]